MMPYSINRISLTMSFYNLRVREIGGPMRLSRRIEEAQSRFESRSRPSCLVYSVGGTTESHADFVASIVRSGFDDGWVSPDAEKEFGHGNTIVIGNRKIAVVTSAMGAAPLYYRTSSHGKLEISSISHEFEGGPSSADGISLAEFLLYGRITSPYSPYLGVERLWPGSIYIFNMAQNCVERAHHWYWHPGLPVDPLPMTKTSREFVHSRLSQCVLKSVQDDSSVLFSGGLDSRIIAGICAHEGIRPEYFMLARTPSLDLHRARLSAWLMGHSIQEIGLKTEGYLSDMHAKIRAVGVGLNLKDAHYWALRGNLSSGSVVDGWTADSLWKSYFSGVREKAFRGDIFDQIAVRRMQKRRILSGLPDDTVQELEQIWPISDHRDFGFRAFLSSIHARTSSPFLYGASASLAVRVPRHLRTPNLLASLFRSELGRGRFVPVSDSAQQNRTIDITPVLVAAAWQAYAKRASRRSVPSRTWPTPKELTRLLPDPSQDRLFGALNRLGVDPEDRPQNPFRYIWRMALLNCSLDDGLLPRMLPNWMDFEPPRGVS